MHGGHGYGEPARRLRTISRQHWAWKAVITPRMFLSRLLLCFVVFQASAVMAQEMVLEPKRLHLGKPGQFEWDFVQGALRWMRKGWRCAFRRKPTQSEHTLRIWQRDVKLGWPVLLNGRKLGTLTASETALECVLAVPADVLREGENVLLIEAPAQLDDIEVGPVFTALPVSEVIGGASIDVTVTDAANDGPLPSAHHADAKRWHAAAAARSSGGRGGRVSVGVVYTRNGRSHAVCAAGRLSAACGAWF
jgi:hypothetical protein